MDRGELVSRPPKHTTSPSTPVHEPDASYAYHVASFGYPGDNVCAALVAHRTECRRIERDGGLGNRCASRVGDAAANRSLLSGSERRKTEHRHHNEHRGHSDQTRHTASVGRGRRLAPLVRRGAAAPGHVIRRADRCVKQPAPSPCAAAWCIVWCLESLTFPDPRGPHGCSPARRRRSPLRLPSRCARRARVHEVALGHWRARARGRGGTPLGMAAWTPSGHHWHRTSAADDPRLTRSCRAAA